MGKSRKRPIYKDKGIAKRKYNSIVRSNINQKIREAVNKSTELDELVLPNPKSIINDYDYCDYIIDLRFEDDPEYFESVEKLKRK